MINYLTLPRGLLCAFLLLACLSAEASISLSVPSQRNIVKFGRYAQVQSVTNSPVSTWAPACEVLKENKVEGCSNKQSHLQLILADVLCGMLFFLGVLVFTYSSTSKGMAFLKCLLYLAFFGGLVFPFVPILDLTAFIAIIGTPVVILTKDCPRVDKIISGITVMIFIAALIGLKIAGLNRFAYMDDFSFPEYLVSSTSTNIVVVHENMDLPYKKIYKSRKEILYRDGRISTVRTNELATLLQAQAEEIRMFKQGTTLKNPE